MLKTSKAGSNLVGSFWRILASMRGKIVRKCCEIKNNDDNSIKRICLSLMQVCNTGVGFFQFVLQDKDMKYRQS